MAGGAAGDFHAHPEAVLVVVDEEFLDFLDEAGGGALVPDDLAAAAEVDGFAEFDGHFEGFGVHIALHEDFAGGVVGGDDGDEAVIIELGGEGETFFDLFDGGAGGVDFWAVGHGRKPFWGLCVGGEIIAEFGFWVLGFGSWEEGRFVF